MSSVLPKQFLELQKEAIIIRNTTGFITSTFGPAGEKDYIVIFDAVRPFVSRQIMQDSLEALTRHEAVVAALPAVDTMLWIEEGTRVNSMPQRSKLFHGQAPDSFRLGTLCQALATLTLKEEQIITGTAQICMLKGIDIHTIP